MDDGIPQGGRLAPGALRAHSRWRGRSGSVSERRRREIPPDGTSPETSCGPAFLRYSAVHRQSEEGPLGSKTREGTRRRVLRYFQGREEPSAMAIRDPLPHKLSYEDYVRFPDDGLRHELIDGEHFVNPAPIEKHQLVSWNLAWFLADYLRRNRLGQAFTAPYDVLFSQHDVVQPDLIYISNERCALRP